MLGFYIGGMGAKGQNYHTKLMAADGLRGGGTEIQDLFFAGKRDEAIAAVPDEFADEISLVGPPSRIKERLEAWREPGDDAHGVRARRRAAEGHPRPRARLTASVAKHPFHDVAIVGVHNTEQARVLEGHDSRTITFEAGLGAIADAGLTPRDIDGVVGMAGTDFLYQAAHRPGVAVACRACGIPAVLEAAGAIANGLATTVLISAGSAGVYTERASTAPWTRPTHEFVAPFGMFTAAEFALIARRHMHRLRHASPRRWPRSPPPSATTAT